MDVRQATLKVKEYYRDVKGMDPLGFDVERATFDEKAKKWTIECSFYRNPLETKRLHFKLIVDDQSGEIRELAPNGSS